MSHKDLLKQCVKLFQTHSLSDIFDVDYTCGEEYITPSLESANPIFCDNVILWSIGKDHRVYIQKMCNRSFGGSFQIKRLHSSTLMDNDIAPKETEYYCIKISLSLVPLERVLNFIRKIIRNDIILHDIEITQDVPYITIRKDVMKHILKNGIIKRDIVDDRRKVGDNCTSFYTPDDSMKIKVYNKFVQMLESCHVMTVLGSRIHNLFIDPTNYMKYILRELLHTGMTRIEVKFYDRELCPMNYYIDYFKQVKTNLEGCNFYKVSLERQWKQLVRRIYNKEVIMIYIKEKKFFAYCHWLNSQTGKIQGGTQKRVLERHIQLLVSNYSFNKTTTKLITITNDNTKVEEYKRTVSNITLIPGPKGSLYPRIRSILSPEDIGLIEFKGVKIGWPDKRIRSDSLPLSPIERVGDNNNNNNELRNITDPLVSHYKAGYSILNIDTIYKVISKGSLYYRGSQCTVIEVKNKKGEILKVRCGRMLEDL